MLPCDCNVSFILYFFIISPTGGDRNKESDEHEMTENFLKMNISPEDLLFQIDEHWIFLQWIIILFVTSPAIYILCVVIPEIPVKFFQRIIHNRLSY